MGRGRAAGQVGRGEGRGQSDHRPAGCRWDRALQTREVECSQDL